MIACATTSRLLASLVLVLGLGTLTSIQAAEARANQLPPASTAGRIAETAAPATALPTLAARFTVRSAGSRQGGWYLSRTAQRIETVNPDTGQNEIWEQSAPQQYSLTRIFHADQRIVEYTPGELRTRHAEPDWAQLASIVPLSWLGQLKRGSERQLFGQKAIHYRGRIGAESIDLWWLEEARLPASLERRGPRGRIALRLEELHEHAPAAWPLASETKIASYGKIDASDFGDMESDPFVARLQKQDGHDHAHAH